MVTERSDVRAGSGERGATVKVLWSPLASAPQPIIISSCCLKCIVRGNRGGVGDVNLDVFDSGSVDRLGHGSREWYKRSSQWTAHQVDHKRKY